MKARIIGATHKHERYHAERSTRQKRKRATSESIKPGLKHAHSRATGDDNDGGGADDDQDNVGLMTIRTVSMKMTVSCDLALLETNTSTGVIVI